MLTSGHAHVTEDASSRAASPPRVQPIPARAHTSPSDPATAQLVVLDSSLVPSVAHFAQWGEQLAAHGFARMRTGALGPRQALQAQTAGLRCIQELVLLQADAPLTVRAERQRTSRRQARHSADLVEVDRLAFVDGWHLDETMLDDVRTATPAARERVVTFRDLGVSVGRSTDGAHPRVAGFLISGRAGRYGYIQRLAVHPDARRNAVAASLLSDALGWLRRHGVARVFVNTHVDNHSALALYRAHGFADLPERLRVFEGPTRR